jgi:hypothetical protein
VAETALLEWIAACARNWGTEGESRGETRAKFFGRARRIAPFLDANEPVALDGGILTREVLAEVGQLAPTSTANERRRNLSQLWRRIIGVGLTDEEFVREGAYAEEFVNSLDERFARLARREEELRKNPVPPDVDPALLEAGYALHDALPDDEKLAQLRAYAVRAWEFSSVAAERFDAHVCTTAYRLHQAARGAVMPKQNDGADVSLTLHLGAGSVLVTSERRLVEIVDASGTFQAAWVRHPDDLDGVPECLPWGAEARAVATSFRRHR